MTTEELIRTELEDLASNFEGSGPDQPWTGQEIADAIRERIKNHHFYAKQGRQMVSIETKIEKLAEFLFESRTGHNPDSRPRWREADPSEKTNFHRDARAAFEWLTIERDNE